ncbi:hypothetical protein SDC9_200786 [bioreactor metagenome]|uniref:Uncharacterized protein n=1 Tax=bioreactor metagenome TaxID=1076179 RepID=A0A645IQF9_9ZZZZ
MRIRIARQLKTLDIHRVGNDGDTLFGNASGDDIRSKALADGEGMSHPLQRPGFHCAGGTIAQATLGRRAMIHRGVLPERPDLVHHRNA